MRDGGDKIVPIEAGECDLAAARTRADAEIRFTARDQRIELRRQDVADFDLQPRVQSP